MTALVMVSPLVIMVIHVGEAIESVSLSLLEMLQGWRPFDI